MADAAEHTTEKASQITIDKEDGQVWLDILKMRASNLKQFALDFTQGFSQLTPESGGKELPFQYVGNLRFDETGFVLTGEMTGDIKQQCDRCGQTYTRSLTHKINERYVFSQLEALNEGTEREWALGELYEIHDAGEPFNITAFMSESIIMGLSYDRYCTDADCNT